MSDNIEDFAPLIIWLVRTRFRGAMARGIQFDDMYQEGMLSVFQNLPKWKEDGVTVASWVYRHAMRDITRYVRKQYKHLGHEDWDRLDEAELVFDKTLERVSHARLTRTESTILRLRFESDLSFREIADYVDSSKSTISRVYHRAIEKLRDDLGQNPSDAGNY